MTTSVYNSMDANEMKIHIFYDIAPFYMAYGIMENKKVAGVRYEKIQTSNLGMRFYAKLEADGYLKEISEKSKDT